MHRAEPSAARARRRRGSRSLDLLEAADDDEAAEVAAVVGDVVVPLGDVRGRRGREDPELLELLLVLGEELFFVLPGGVRRRRQTRRP